MFIQIAVDENIDLVKKIINEKSLTTLNLIDTRLKIEEEFQLEGFPTYLIIGKNGEILGHDIAGPLSPGLVDVIIYKALENQKSRDVVHYMVKGPITKEDDEWFKAHMNKEISNNKK